MAWPSSALDSLMLNKKLLHASHRLNLNGFVSTDYLFFAPLLRWKRNQSSFHVFPHRAEANSSPSHEIMLIYCLMPKKTVAFSLNNSKVIVNYDRELTTAYLTTHATLDTFFCLVVLITSKTLLTFLSQRLNG